VLPPRRRPGGRRPGAGQERHGLHVRRAGGWIGSTPTWLSSHTSSSAVSVPSGSSSTKPRSTPMTAPPRVRVVARPRPRCRRVVGSRCRPPPARARPRRACPPTAGPATGPTTRGPRRETRSGRLPVRRSLHVLLDSASASNRDHCAVYCFWGRRIFGSHLGCSCRQDINACRTSQRRPSTVSLRVALTKARSTTNVPLVLNDQLGAVAVPICRAADIGSRSALTSPTGTATGSATATSPPRNAGRRSVLGFAGSSRLGTPWCRGRPVPSTRRCWMGGRHQVHTHRDRLRRSRVPGLLTRDDHHSQLAVGSLCPNRHAP